MEKILSDLIGTVKNYFKIMYLYSRGVKGFYFYLISIEKEGAELEKYANLVFCFLLYYFISQLAVPNLLLNTTGILRTYSALIFQILTGDGGKEHLKLLIGLVFILEILAFFAGKKKSERALFSRFNFLVASWCFCVFAFFILIVSVIVTIFDLLAVKPEYTFIGGFLMIGIGLFMFWRLFYPVSAISYFQDHKRMNVVVVVKGLGLNLLIPVVIFLLVRGLSITTKPGINVYFLEGHKSSKEQICFEAYPLPNNTYLLETALIVENLRSSTLVFDPKTGGFAVHWRFSDVRWRSDSIALRNADTTLVGLSSHVPQRLNLKALISSKTFSNLQFVKDRSTFPNLYFNLYLLNEDKIAIGDFPFKIILHN